MVSTPSTPATELPAYMTADDLRLFTKNLLVAVHVPDTDAAIVADVLVTGDLRGVESHGVARLDSYYISRIRKGLINTNPEIQMTRESPVSIAMDGGNGLGQIASYRAMSAIIDKAKVSGIGMATVKHSNHFGIAAYYAMMASDQNLIGMAFTNTQPLVMPIGAKKIMTGTNPIAVAVPAGREQPWVLDMATSVVPKGKLEVMARKGLAMPYGWAVDKNGLPTTDPLEALDGGAPMPLGSTLDLGGHKGSHLAIFVDIFSGVLSGAGFGPHISQATAADIGHFFLVFKPDLFIDLQEFHHRMESFVQELKSAPPVAGQDHVIVAGEPENEKRKGFQETGIAVHPKVMNGLLNLASELGVPSPPLSYSPLNG